MVETYHVIKLRGISYSSFPPRIVVSLHLVPVIERITPKLSVLVEVIWRNSAYFFRYIIAVQLEHLRFLPDISTVQGYIDRNVPDNSYVVILGILT